MAIIIVMIIRNIHPPRFGVPLLCLCSSIKLTAFSPVMAVSRIVLPIFSLRNSAMYGGYARSARKNAASAYMMIEFNLTSMDIVFSKRVDCIFLGLACKWMLIVAYLFSNLRAFYVDRVYYAEKV